MRLSPEAETRAVVTTGCGSGSDSGSETGSGSAEDGGASLSTGETAEDASPAGAPACTTPGMASPNVNHSAAHTAAQQRTAAAIPQPRLFFFR